MSRNELLIVIFIYLSIFINSYIFIQQPFEIYFGYLVYILLLPGFFRKYNLNKELVIIFLVLFLTGLFNILIDNNTFELFFKVYIGLFLSYVFYYFVFVEFNFNIEKLFKWYLTGCYLAALIGLFQFLSFLIGFNLGYDYTFILNKWGVIKGGLFGIRINSIFSEPTYLATVLSGSFFISIYNIIRKQTYHLSRFKSLVIIIVYFLSFSGVGQLGIFLTLLFLVISFGIIRYLLLLIPLVLIFFNVIYNNVDEFKDRYDGLVNLFQGEKFQLGKTHGSSFILYNNFIVTTENFKSNFIFGTGIGSHPVAFKKYSQANNFKIFGFNSNSADANSMLLRLISETGLFGTLIFIIILFKCYVKRDKDKDTYHWLVSNSLIVLILLNLFRQGHYFLNGFPFFLFLYYYNSVSYNKYLEDLEDNTELIKSE